jgi:hypothetical protein
LPERFGDVKRFFTSPKSPLQMHGNTEQPNDKYRQGPIITDQGAGTVLIAGDRRTIGGVP